MKGIELNRIRRTSRRARQAAWIACCLLLGAGAASAQTGVSDDRVSLPDGPGSIEGLGDNVSVDGNMGAMSYSIPIELPEGYAGMTPELALSYSSGAGNGLVGVGWSMRVPTIERLTLRGLPRYVADDELAADGSEQLVRVSESGTTAVYRARFERGFVRYTWLGAGEAGYFTAEYPDGRIGYFGATAGGTIVPEARLESASGETFRYFLVELLDVHGHRVRYEYEKSGVTPLLRRIGWVFEGAEPRYAVELEYEARPDPISDAQPGFEELLTERVWFVRVRSRGEAIRSYRLTYEDEATSGGFSRINMVERIGRDGSVYPVVHTFGYSRSLGGVCGAGRCDRPFVVDMGTLDGAAGIATGDATLVDINGDALPDLVDSSMTGPHRFYDNVLDGDGRAHFEAARASATTPRNGFELNQAYVQVLDINGDGFADLANARSGQARCNRASGDWETTGCGALSDEGITLGDDGDATDGDTDPLNTRFVDLNADRRIDLLRTNSAADVEAWLNTGDGFTSLPDAEAIGRVFDGDRLQLADINGDGMLDAVVVESGTVRYRLSLGYGRWAAWVTIDGPSIESDSAMNDTELQDVNGDGLDDLVIVQGSTLRYSLNRGAGRFDPFVSITSADVDGGMPTREPTTTVLFADMNGSGSQDAVWVEASGRVRFLELFPVRPNLMSRLENGLGMVHAITYGTSVAHQAASETPWRYTLPHAMNVVDRTDTWVTLTGGEDGEGLHEVVEYAYRDGFYDGIEKAFRGFASVEQRMLAELSRDSQEPALTIQVFDVGADDPYYAGLPLSSAVFSGEDARPLSEERHAYADCEVAGVPESGLRFDVRHVCEVETTRIAQEGAPQDEWATTRRRMDYDGYGQLVRSEDHGVVHMGPPESPSACAPCQELPDGLISGACGESCTGDEMIETRAYIEPGSATGDRWIVGRSHTVRRFASDGGPATEEHTYYDGEDFVGLALGQLRDGLPTRVTTRASESVVLETTRNAYDAHGNVVATLDPLGAPDDTTGHRRAYTYDAAGLRVVRTTIFVSSGMGEPYTLRQEYSYEPAFDKVVESSAWMVEGSPRNPTYYAYDEFARVVAIAKPGDTLSAPSLEVTWELGDPASRIVMRRRSEPGAEADLEAVRCVDGRGRTYQERTRIADGEWLVDGFTEHNRRGAEVRLYQPHTEASGECALAPPSGVAFTTVQYDGAQREVRRTMPDAEIHGSASVTRMVYEPLATLTYDANDNDPESPHADTPSVTRTDGLGRPVAVERLLRADAGIERSVTRLLYDTVGSLSGYVDALGNVKTQEVDLANRIVRVSDPNGGETRFEHDAAGNVIRRVDARGVATRTEYDGVNRPIARYDEASHAASRVTYRYDLAGDCEGCTNTAGQLVESTYPLPAELAALVGGAMGEDHAGYDARGQNVHSARTLGAVHLATADRFDGAGRNLETTYPDGQRLTRRFDGVSRLTAIDGLVDSVEYDARGQIARVVRADGTEEAFEYDALLRVAGLTSTAADGVTIQDLTYARDRAGNVMSMDDGATYADGLPSASASYAYDAWYRVRGADLGAGAETLAFAYDAIDNVLSATSTLGGASAAHVGEYAYGRPAVASQAGALRMTHDAAGYLTERGELALEWDFLGRLTRAERGGDAAGIFAYGPDQRRVAKVDGGYLTLYAGRDFEVRDGVSRAYARNERVRVARSASTALGVALYGDASDNGEVDAGDAWLEGDELDARHAAAARRLLHEAAPEPVHLIHDELGSVVAATREGDVIGRRRYHPFGAIRAERGFLDERGFTGQELDASTGLLAFEHRYLDPRTGRWASADPAFETVGDDVGQLFEGIGRYAYVGNHPINAFDPLGLVQIPSWMTWKNAIIGTALVIGVAALAVGAGPVAVTAGAVGLFAMLHSEYHNSKDNAALREQNEALTQEVTTLRNNLQTVQSDLQTVQAAVATLNNRTSTLETAVGAPSTGGSAATGLHGAVAGLQAAVGAPSTSGAAATGLHGAVSGLQRSVSGLRTAGDAQSTQIGALQTASQQHEAAIGGLRTNVAGLNQARRSTMTRAASARR